MKRMKISLFCVNSDSNSASKVKQNGLPIFRASVILAIPNISMAPALEHTADAEQSCGVHCHCQQGG